MLLICLVVVFSAMLRLGEAQSSSTTSSSAAATHTVSVGAAGLVFTPDTVTANVGDIVEYRFYPQNHSVARADFKSPCIPYEISGPGRVGFWAGFHPLNVVPSDPPSYQVKINDTSPIFFYCSAPGACIEDGMVGVINPNDTQTLAIQKAYAKNSTIEFSPGESFPVESASSKSSSAALTSTSSSAPSSTAPATSTTAPTTTSTPTPTAAAAASKPALSGGAIAGVAIGGAAVVVLAGALIYLCGRQRTLGEIVTQQQQHPPPHGPPSYLPGHLSMASATTYPPKTPKFDVDSLGARRYSGQVAHPGFYDRSATETESYRSRSPPFDEGRELTIPNLHPAMSSGQTSPGSPTRGGSPMIRRPGPERPSPVSPLEEQIYQPLTADVPAALRVDRNSSQRGPHELDVESGRDYYPYIHDPDPGYGEGQIQGRH